MRGADAVVHFIQLASAWHSELAESEQLTKGPDASIEGSIEDFTADFQLYLADSLRGRGEVDPEHPIFESTERMRSRRQK